MTIMGPDELNRNWLWLGVDQHHCVGFFSSFFNGTLPPDFSSSLEDAEIIEEFIASTILPGSGHCQGIVNRESRGYSWRLRGQDSTTAAKWEGFVRASTAAASSGVYVYEACIEEGRPAGYYQVAYPAEPIRIDSLPSHMRRIVERVTLGVTSFAYHAYVAVESINPLARLSQA